MTKKQQPHPDQIYVDGLVAGNQKIIVSIYERYLPMIIKYVQNNSGQLSDAEDIFNSALEIIFLQGRDGLTIQQSFGAYLSQICRFRWINRLRRDKKVDFDLSKQEEVSLDPAVLKQLEEKEKYLMFRKHFNALPERCRSILELKFRDKNYREIAEKLVLSHNFVRRRGSECIELLTKNIQQDPLFGDLT